MGALPIIADTYRCALNWTDGTGLNFINVIHVLKAGSSASAIAAFIDANVTGSMWGYVSGDFIMERLDVLPLDGVSARYELATSGAKWTGQGTGDAIPNLCALLNLHSGFRGPQHRGRLFLGPVCEGQQVKGALPAGVFFNNVQAAWNAFLATATGGGFQPVIASYVHAGQVPITSWTLSNICATQRRRQNQLR
jgi:hypothetical protein